jgi:hypothetical protein
MAKPLKPGQVIALNKRRGDTWLTCLKFLIPVYALYYLIARRTVTPWVAGFAFSLLIGAVSSASDTRSGIDISAPDYYDLSPGLGYLFSPITMGVGAMKAKRYANKRLLELGEAETT